MYGRRKHSKVFWCGMVLTLLASCLSGNHEITATPIVPSDNQIIDESQTSQTMDIKNRETRDSDSEDSEGSSEGDHSAARTNSTTTGPATMPNIIFAMANDLGWGDVGYNGGKALTPNLNEMARSPNTILLQRYYSGSPVCSPTRGTVLTGRNHNRYCVWSANTGNNEPDFTIPQRRSLPLSEITVAEVMREAGYSTALFGKWHIGDFKPLKGGNKKWPVSHPGLHGFDQWFATERSAPTATINCGCFPDSRCITGHYTARRPPCTNYYTNKSGEIEGWPEAISGGDSDFIYSLAENYIKEQVNENKPFFLYLPFHAVHERYIATKRYQNMYRNKNYTSKQIDYYGTVSELDDAMGKLRKLLKDLDIKNNTLLWFSSDNGPKSPGMTGGLRGRKRLLYEGGIRVPGMIEWPDVITSNKASSFPVVSSDLLPTVRDILGINPPDNRTIARWCLHSSIFTRKSRSQKPFHLLGFSY